MEFQERSKITKKRDYKKQTSTNNSVVKKQYIFMYPKRKKKENGKESTNKRIYESICTA